MTVPYIFADQIGTIPLSELDANFANVKAAADTAGVVTTNAQPNITSLGTLSSLSVTGNVTVGRISGNGSQLTSLNGSNVTGFVGNASYATLATTATTANSVAGANVTGTVATATAANTANIANIAYSISASNVSGTVANATYAVSAATVTNGTQSNITGVGTLTSVSVSGNVKGGNLNTAGTISVSGSIITAANIISHNSNAIISLATSNTANANIAFILGTGVDSATFSFSRGATNYGFQVSSYANIIGNVRAGNVLTPGYLTATGNVIAGNVLSSGIVKSNSGTVTGLPVASAAGAGARSFVTDATSNTFGAVATGGGSNKMPVFSNGTGWFIG